MRNNRKVALLAAAVAASIFGTRAARATDFVWDGSDGTNPSWSNGLNWTSDSAPSAAADTVTFDSNGLANPSNTVDASLATTIFTQLNYRVNDATKTYTTSIDRGVTLTLANPALITATQVATVANSTFVVMPANGATAGNPTGTKVVIQSTGSGTQGGINIVSGNFIVTGRPSAATSSDSYAILDLTGLDSFTFNQPSSPVVNGVFAIGQGNSTIADGTDNNAYWGKVILGPKATINVNRVIVGGQNNASSPQGTQPVSTLLLGPDSAIGTGYSGNVYIGFDAASGKDSSGAVLFRAGLTDPKVTIGDSGAHHNGLEIGSNRFASTGHRAYGVLDTTAASGGSDGEMEAHFAGFMSIGRGAGGAGGSAGMVSLDKGSFVNNGFIFLASSGSASNTQVTLGVVNVSGTGSFATIRDGATPTDGSNDPLLAVGRRSAAGSGVMTGILNISGSASAEAERIFLGLNSAANNGAGGSTGIINLNGGTLTTYQVQAGGDGDLGTNNNTRLLNFNGGALKAKSGTTYGATFVHDQATTGAGIQAYVYAGGGTIDTNGENVTISQALLAPTGSGLSSVSVTFGGAGYRAAPIVNISGGGGVGATAVAQIDSTGAVTGVTVTNPGTGYTSAPTIDLIANGGTNYANTLVPYGGTVATTSSTLAANTSGGITKTGLGKLTLTGSNTYTGVTTVAAGTLLLGAAAQHPVMDLGGADVKGGTLGFDYTGGTSPAGTIVPILATGYANNFATGQIHSSTAGGNKGLGYKDNGTNEFDVMLTFFGDANLDGVVNSGDFGVLSNAYNAAGGWDKGDFNYDGIVNALDFNTLAANYGSDLNPPPPGLGSLVPEPMSIGLLGLGAIGLMRRRRR